MKTKIYYFSGTGNSLKVARDLAEKIDAETIPIISVKDDIDEDKIGIVFPVYEFGLPSIVVEFLKKIKNSRYIFAVATYGGLLGATLQILEKNLPNNLKLSGGFSVQMPGNFTPLYGALAEEKQKKFFTKAKTKLDEISEYIKSEKTGTVEKGNPIASLVLSGWIYPMAIKHIHDQDEKYWVDDKCDGCKVCMNVCPKNNISMDNGKPIWNHDCELCMACLQWCPKEAIQHGKNTQGRTRYRHPEIKVKDIMDQKA
jgi:ferredoxin